MGYELTPPLHPKMRPQMGVIDIQNYFEVYYIIYYSFRDAKFKSASLELTSPFDPKMRPQKGITDITDIKSYFEV